MFACRKIRSCTSRLRSRTTAKHGQSNDVVRELVRECCSPVNGCGRLGLRQIQRPAILYACLPYPMLSTRHTGPKNRRTVRLRPTLCRLYATCGVSQRNRRKDVCVRVVYHYRRRPLRPRGFDTHLHVRVRVRGFSKTQLDLEPAKDRNRAKEKGDTESLAFRKT